MGQAGIDSSRANFLLRQANKNPRVGQNEQRGSYGHMIRKKDERVHGISALAQKILMEKAVQYDTAK